MWNRQCNYHAKIDLLFVCSHIKAPQLVLINGLQHFLHDQKVKTGFKTSQNPINTLFKIKKKGEREEKGEGGIDKGTKCEGLGGQHKVFSSFISVVSL